MSLFKKKYTDLKDYFVHKKDLNKYIKWDGCLYFMENDVVKFSNKHTTSCLSFNIDNFKNTTIIFENSSFLELNISEYCNDIRNNKIIFKNCTFDNCSAVLLGDSDVSFINCRINDQLIVGSAKKIFLYNTKVGINKVVLSLGNSKTENVMINGLSESNFTVESKIKLNVDAKNIDISNIKSSVKLHLGNKETENILINNINSLLDSNKPLVFANSNNIEICNSYIYLQSNFSNSIMLNNSVVYMNKINNNSISLNSSRIDGCVNDSQKIGMITTQSISVDGNSNIENYMIKSDDVVVNYGAGLVLSDSLLGVSNLLELREDSSILSNDNKSALSANDTIMYSNANINVNKSKYKNNSKNEEITNLNMLYDERKKLVKVLKTAVNKPVL